MTRPPLTANGIAILRMHHAGIPHDRIASVGEHRGSWAATDVAQVVADWARPDRDNMHVESRGGPGSLPREHGTQRGYYQHRKYGEMQCDACLGSRRTPDDQRKPRAKKPKKETPKRMRGVDAMANCCWYRQRVVGQAETELTTAARRAASRPTPKNLETLEIRKADVEAQRRHFKEHVAGCTAGVA